MDPATQQQLEANAARQEQFAADGLIPEERVIVLTDGSVQKMKWSMRALATFEKAAGGFSNVDPNASIELIALWAYALSAAHRRKCGQILSFDDFFDLLPAEEQDIAQLTERVTACLPESMKKGSDEGNVESPASQPAPTDG